MRLSSVSQHHMAYFSLLLDSQGTQGLGGWVVTTGSEIFVLAGKVFVRALY